VAAGPSAPATAPAAPAAGPAEPVWRTRLTRLAGWGIIAFLIGSVIVLHDDVKAWAQVKAQDMGLLGLFIAVFLTDSVIQPIPPDIFAFGAGFGDLPVWEVGMVAGVASTTGGMAGYFIGRVVGPWRFRRWFGRTLFKMARAAYRNYGALTIFIGAVTPVPYSAICWVGGIYRVSPWVVLITSFLSRTGRFLLMGWFGAAV
jgi:membrane protein YqaA with SNARE-associated domain